MELFEKFDYSCKWGLSDLYPEAEAALRFAMNAHEPFDTGWGYCRKEIRAFRVSSEDGENLIVETHEDIDDPEDLIYDALEDDAELPEDIEDSILDRWYAADGVTGINDLAIIPITTYEALMKELERQEEANSKFLDGQFQLMKAIVSECIKEGSETT